MRRRQYRKRLDSSGREYGKCQMFGNLTVTIVTFGSYISRFQNTVNNFVVVIKPYYQNSCNFVFADTQKVIIIIAFYLCMIQKLWLHDRKSLLKVFNDHSCFIGRFWGALALKPTRNKSYIWPERKTCRVLHFFENSLETHDHMLRGVAFARQKSEEYYGATKT